MTVCPHYLGETSVTLLGGGSRHVSPPPHVLWWWADMWSHPLSHAITRRRIRCSPVEETRSGRPSSHAPIRAKRSTTDSHAFPLSRNKAVRPLSGARGRTLRQKLLNRETLSNRLAPPPVPQQTPNHPEQTIERGKHDSQTSPENGDTRVDNEPLHHEAHGASATTMREPVLRAHTTRVVERARKRDTVAETHFQSNLSS